MIRFNIVLDNEKVQVLHQTGSNKSDRELDHYRITVRKNRLNNEWERYYVRREQEGSHYENRAMEILAEILTR